MKENEINKAYRSADSDNYAKNPLIIGKEIRASTTTKKRDIPKLERRLAGKYPTWFKWHWWCDNDLSFISPILMEEELFSKFQRLVARGEDTPEAVKDLQTGHRIEALPDNFKAWANETIQNQQDFENAPYFITENFEDFNHLQLHINN